MIEFEHKGTRYHARARRMVKHWLIHINEVGKEEEQTTHEYLADGVSEAEALKKGIFAFFGKEET